MANRWERQADKKQTESNQSTLRALLKEPGNRICADCKRKDPRWASANIGVFVCIRCSGTHRSMGTHISKVRSVDLDSWTPDQVEVMTRWGNVKANLYWEANIPPNYVVDDNQADTFIRNKYERKKWAAAGPVPDPATLTGSYSQSIKQTAAKPVESPKKAGGLLMDDLLSLGDAPTPAKQEDLFSDFQSFQAAPSVPVTTQKSTKDDIMSLFTSAPSFTAPPAFASPASQPLPNAGFASQPPTSHPLAKVPHPSGHIPSHPPSLWPNQPTTDFGDFQSSSTTSATTKNTTTKGDPFGDLLL